ncbi:hypothetical protein EV188_101717 [Actinomycetospora succinea]|uniref:Uncharacterized protein n=1 Tax=Actinomycetospora succinea TaxID=663603 RepID=A0A4R6VY20_9PSEU|nr:hypothetical protein [Actinomycetospora succinea]TDQ65465.1 hypothetical protein EV188_101717 [Actinomycetospora succinea]
MNAVLLAVHVLAAIVAIGPVCVAASMFPPEARQALNDDPGAASRLPVLARICRTYAVVGVAVPVFGLATAASMGVLMEGWVLVSIVLTLAAAGVLAGVVLPRQRALLEGVGPRDVLVASTGRLAAATGVFNLLWAVVAVLMIVRPGSTTGV